jgi:hypothetical protein
VDHVDFGGICGITQLCSADVMLGRFALAEFIGATRRQLLRRGETEIFEMRSERCGK